MSSKTDTEKTSQTVKGDIQELIEENASLKRQICGFKKSNNSYKKQAKNDDIYIKSLQNVLEDAKDEVDRIKTYAKESDEKKDEQIASLNATIKEKDRVIDDLQYQIAELNKRIANNEKNIQDLTDERDVAIANYDYVCRLPWYQRMFFKYK